MVTYRDPTQDKILTVKAKSISDSSLGLSFIRISDFLFESDSLLVKPDEEAMKKRFEDVKSLHLSIYTIISIEEIGKKHSGLRFQNDKSNLVVLSSADKPKPKKP